MKNRSSFKTIYEVPTMKIPCGLYYRHVHVVYILHYSRDVDVHNTHGSLHPHNHIHSHKAKLAFSGQSTLPQKHPPNMKPRSPHMTPHELPHLHTPPLPPFMQVNFEPIDHHTACYMHFNTNQMPNPSHSHPFILPMSTPYSSSICTTQNVYMLL